MKLLNCVAALGLSLNLAACSDDSTDAQLGVMAEAGLSTGVMYRDRAAYTDSADNVITINGTRYDISAASIEYGDNIGSSVGKKHDDVGADASVLFANLDDGDIIDIRGYLVKRISDDEYLFETGGRTIVVEIDDFAFPRQEFNERNLLNITVKVDLDFLEPMELEVERIDVL